ncbi:hypothetical protein [Sphingobacterium kitahiroshimense]|uniref:Uncharacterized protein n=1 Tax=Sphingobacterium kitahiroshimense TaxID=470446 RepID=A0ABV0BPV0_9SPHI
MDEMVGGVLLNIDDLPKVKEVTYNQQILLMDNINYMVVVDYSCDLEIRPDRAFFIFELLIIHKTYQSKMVLPFNITVFFHH